jgi:uncharacterized protein
MSEKKMNMVGWFEIYVENMDRAKAFYETVFQTTITPMTPPEGSELEMMGFPGDETASNYGAPGALVKMEGFGPGTGGTMVYFSSADCAGEESRVVAAGGEVIKPKGGLDEYGYMTIIKDTEGNVVGIHSMQ